MSSNTNDYNSDLDAILAEFSSYSKDISGAVKPDGAQKDRPEERQPGSGDGGGAQYYVDVSRLESYLSAHQVQKQGKPEGSAPAEEKEEFSPLFTPSGRAYRRPDAWSIPGIRERRTPAPEPDKYLNYSEKKKAAAIQRREEAAQAKLDAQKSALRRKDKDAAAAQERIREVRARAQTPAKNIMAVIFAVLAILAVCWAAVHIHPDSGTSTAARMQKELNLTSRLDVYANNAVSDVLSDYTDIKKMYAIAETDTIAPKPDPDGFGRTTEPAVIQSVIAASAELLGGQKTVWQSDRPFSSGAEMYYYSDPTILAIVWKEELDGCCATLAEIKIADGSQFRRKLAGDTYGSPVYLNASTMAGAANAVVASNADCYAFRQSGLTVYQRQLFRNSADKLDTCFITAGGDMLFLRAGEPGGDDAVKDYIAENDVLFSLAFGPVLVDGGVLQQCVSYPIGEVRTEAARAGIGMTDGLHYLLMTVNGTDSRPGISVNEFAELMYDRGCVKAYNLSGGQTAEITIQGEPANDVDCGAERAVSDMIYFATALPGAEVAG